MQTAFVQELEFAPNIDIYANVANEAVYSNVSLHQNRFFATNLPTNSLDPLPSPPPNSNSITYAFTSNEQTPQTLTPFTNHTLTTSEPQNYIPPVPSQLPNHSAMNFKPRAPQQETNATARIVIRIAPVHRNFKQPEVQNTHCLYSGQHPITFSSFHFNLHILTPLSIPKQQRSQRHYDWIRLYCIYPPCHPF
jgi:hypothetical protein